MTKRSITFHSATNQHQCCKHDDQKNIGISLSLFFTACDTSIYENRENMWQEEKDRKSTNKLSGKDCPQGW